MTALSLRASLQPCAGLVIAPLAWATMTQLGQILPPAQCRAGWPILALACLAGLLVSLGAGFLSWNSVGANRRASDFPVAHDFVGMLGALSGAGFAFVLALQGLSSIMLTGCER
jgi:hypothetical protein